MFIKIWHIFCVLVVRTFYRQYEVAGLENLANNEPVLLCANHANALADAVVLQAVSPRHIHPMARSGLFKNPVLLPVLRLIKAIPVYRRQDTVSSDMEKNQDSFQKCYELFDNNGVLLIFPEGQSHSDPRLRPLKTGAARIVTGAYQFGGKVPLVIPVGLNFSNKGRFRSTVFIRFGAPVKLKRFLKMESRKQTRELITSIYAGMADVTLNLDTHEELDFIRSLERFFAFRHGKYRQRSLELRFRALKKLADAEMRLKQLYPEKLQQIKKRLQNFERLCRTFDIRDYHLTVKFNFSVVARFLMRSLWILLVILPLGLLGILNSYIPFILTRMIAKKISKGVDQYDTAKMVIGLFLFSLCWGGLTAIIGYFISREFAIYYLLLIIPTTASAIMLRNERKRMLENIRVFFLFIRKRNLRAYLELRRHELERDLAHLVRLTKKKLN